MHFVFCEVKKREKNPKENNKQITNEKKFAHLACTFAHHNIDIFIGFEQFSLVFFSEFYFIIVCVRLSMNAIEAQHSLLECWSFLSSAQTDDKRLDTVNEIEWVSEKRNYSTLAAAKSIILCVDCCCCSFLCVIFISLYSSSSFKHRVKSQRNKTTKKKNIVKKNEEKEKKEKIKCTHSQLNQNMALVVWT